jgi:hypothetical protein
VAVVIASLDHQEEEEEEEEGGRRRRRLWLDATRLLERARMWGRIGF